MIYVLYCKSIKIIFYRLCFILCKIYKLYAIIEYDWALDARGKCQVSRTVALLRLKKGSKDPVTWKNSGSLQEAVRVLQRY